MLTSLSKLLPGKRPHALSYIYVSSSLACRNSYFVHHNVSNSLLPLPFSDVWNKARALRFHNFGCISFVSSEFLKQVQKTGKRFVQLRAFIRIRKNTLTGLKNPQNCLFSSHLFFSCSKCVLNVLSCPLVD